MGMLLHDGKAGDAKRALSGIFKQPDRWLCQHLIQCHDIMSLGKVLS